jgi:hypothetical protein
VRSTRGATGNRAAMSTMAGGTGTAQIRETDEGEMEEGETDEGLCTKLYRLHRQPTSRRRRTRDESAEPSHFGYKRSCGAAAPRGAARPDRG